MIGVVLGGGGGRAGRVACPRVQRAFVDRVTRLAGWLRRSHRVAVPSHGPVKVNLGSSLLAAEGWVNVDGALSALVASWPTPALRLFYRLAGIRAHMSEAEYIEVLKRNRFVHHNLEYGIPLPDASADFAFASHFLEHLSKAHGEHLVRETLRVLRPGGRFVFAGEPTTVGDWYARHLGRLTWKATGKVTHLPALRDRWSRPAAELDESSRAAALESVVDLHTFDPRELAATALRAGAVDVHTVTEELTAAFLGWPVRTFEAAVNPHRLGRGWAMFAYRSWQQLSAVDRVLGRVLPQALFYNVLVTGTRPG